MNLWPLYYVLRDAREGTSRNPLASVAVILMIALAVTFSGGTWLALEATRSFTDLLREQAQMRVILAPGGAGPEALARDIRSLPGVRGVTFVSGAETLRRMESAFSGSVDLGSVFQDNPFPDSLDVDVADAARAPGLAKRIEAMPGVGQVVYGQRYLAPLLRLADAIRRIGWTAAAGFGAVALLVSIVTWQLAFLNRLPEVRIKQWMGVSPGAIRGQFVLEGALLGLAGGALAALGLVYGVSVVLANLRAVVPGLGATAAPLGWLVAGCLLSGAALGGLGAALAHGRSARTGVGA